MFLRGVLRKAPQVSWQDVRSKLITEVCSSAGGTALPVSALVRRDAAALKRLDDLIFLERINDGPLRLASLLDLRGEHEEALSLLDERARRGEIWGRKPAPEARLLRELIRRHVDCQKEREAMMEREAPAAKAIELPRIDTLDATGIGRDEFHNEYVLPGRPCVLRGVWGGDAGLPLQWTPEELCRRLGRRQVPLRRCVDDSAAWARLEFAGSMPFDQYVAKHILAGGAAIPQDDPQVFDHSIWQQCEDALGRDILMPKWFPVDMYSYATARVHPVSGSASPTLFLAAAGTRSSLHVDFLHTNFWMVLCRGRKRWRLVPSAHLPCLYPMYLADLNPSFPADLDAVQANRVWPDPKYPAHAHAEILETILEPGDLIFVPRGWAHQVENLEISVAVSGNFIDGSNLQASLGEAELLGLVSEDPMLLAKELRDAHQSGVVERLAASAPERHSGLREFKARHGESRTPHETQRIVIIAAGSLLATVGLASAALYSWALSVPSPGPDGETTGQ